MASKSTKTDFNREETEFFINCYLAQECLWNVSSPNYANRGQRLAAQKMICMQMTEHGKEINADQVVSKISSLRTYYGRELRKVVNSEKSGSSCDDIYQSPWEFFKLLDPFLRSQVQQRPSKSNLIVGTTNVEDSEPQAADTAPDDDTSNMCVTDEIKNHCATPDQGSHQKQKKRKTSSPDLNSVLYKTLLNMQNRNQSDHSQDTDFLFGKQVGLELKKIQNQRKKQELKLRIQQLIFDYQFENEI